MPTVTAFVPLAGDAEEVAEIFTSRPERWLAAGHGCGAVGSALGARAGLVRPVVLDPPAAPVRMTGRLELRMSLGRTMLLLHVSYDGHGDGLRKAAHRYTARILGAAAAGLDPVQARRRARMNHPSSGRALLLEPTGRS